MRDETSFEEFYAGVFNRLVGQLFLVTGSLPEAEDVVQEALTRAAGRWARLRDSDVPEIWVRPGGHEPGHRWVPPGAAAAATGRSVGA